MTAAKTAAKPAFDFDMTKMFGQFKAPGFDIEAMMAAQRKNLEVAAAANQKAFEGITALATRQAEMMREGAETAMKVASEFAAAAPEERATKQADYMKSAYTTAVANGRETYDMASKLADETFAMVNDRVTATMDETKKVFAAK